MLAASQLFNQEFTRFARLVGRTAPRLKSVRGPRVALAHRPDALSLSAIGRSGAFRVSRAQRQLLAIRPDALQLFGERFARVDNRLQRGGVPTTREHFQALADAHVKDIVSLMDRHDPKELPFIANEQALAREFGMRVHVLPMPFQKAVPAESLQRFLKVMRRTKGESVYMHCKNGRDRTGTMVAFYRLATDGFGHGRALAEMKKFGYNPANPQLAYLGDFLHTVKATRARSLWRAAAPLPLVKAP